MEKASEACVKVVNWFIDAEGYRFCEVQATAEDVPNLPKIIHVAGKRHQIVGWDKDLGTVVYQWIGR